MALLLALPGHLHGEVTTWLDARDVACLCASCRTLGASLAALDGLWRLRLRDAWLPTPLGYDDDKGQGQHKGQHKGHGKGQDKSQDKVQNKGKAKETALLCWLGREARAARWQAQRGVCSSAWFHVLCDQPAAALGIWRDLLLVGTTSGCVAALQLPFLTLQRLWRIDVRHSILRVCPSASGTWLLTLNSVSALGLWRTHGALSDPQRAEPPRLECHLDTSGVPGICELLVREEAGTVVALGAHYRLATWRLADGARLSVVDPSPPLPCEPYPRLVDYDGRQLAFSTGPALWLPGSARRSSGRDNDDEAPQPWSLLSLRRLFWGLECPDGASSPCSLGSLDRRRLAPSAPASIGSLRTEATALAALFRIEPDMVFQVAASARYFVVLSWNERLGVCDFGKADVANGT